MTVGSFQLARPVSQRIIADRKVKTRGQRRGMTYAAV
jgi:hypothetical protein